MALAGVDGAKPGIVMKANPLVGEYYRQEFALGTAEDNAEVTGLNISNGGVPFAFAHLHARAEVAQEVPDATPKVCSGPTAGRAPLPPLAPSVDDPLVVNPDVQGGHREL